MRKYGMTLQAQILGLLDDSFTTRYAFKEAVESMACRAAEMDNELAEYKAAEASLFSKESRRIFGALRKKAREEANKDKEPGAVEPWDTPMAADIRTTIQDPGRGRT